MITGELIRNCFWPTGTYGTLTVNGVTLQTVEQPWRDNRRFVSCIPNGSYLVRRHTSPKFGKCWAVLGNGLFLSQAEADQGRYAILIHAANWPDQLNGCIAPGLERRILPSSPRQGFEAIGVTSSRTALDRLEAALKGVEEWVLEVRSFAT